jgi:hypothetical protein
MSPETPSGPAAAVASATEPLEVSAEAPEVMRTEPPVAFDGVVAPAVTLIEPPGPFKRRRRPARCRHRLRRPARSCQSESRCRRCLTGSRRCAAQLHLTRRALVARVGGRDRDVDTPAAAKPLVTATEPPVPASAAPAEMLTLPPRFDDSLPSAAPAVSAIAPPCPALPCPKKKKVRRRRVAAAQHDRATRAHPAARLALLGLAGLACSRTKPPFSSAGPPRRRRARCFRRRSCATRQSEMSPESPSEASPVLTLTPPETPSRRWRS